jgi:hypothetical protein
VLKTEYSFVKDTGVVVTSLREGRLPMAGRDGEVAVEAGLPPELALLIE